MPRTTRTLIGQIIELDVSIVPDDASMAPFIEIASELVTEFCTGANGPRTPYTEQRLEIIERWLAAHFYTTRDPRASAETAGAVSVTYQSRVDLGFDSSHFGQAAMRLDTNGGLAKLNENSKKGGRPSVGAVWLGTKLPTDI